MSPRRTSQPPADRSKLKNVALFKEDDELTSSTVQLDKIVLPATQPRRYFDTQAMQSLVESVKQNGILQPLLVRPAGDKYELVAGEVIEQITYLLFLRRLDDLHTLEENKANRLKRPMERRIFPEGIFQEGLDIKKRSYDDLRWSRFKHFAAPEMFAVVNNHVFPFLRSLGGDDSTYAHHMKDARFTIPTPALLSKVVDLLDSVPMEDRDTKGDLYEYMLGKIASAGQNGQFRTPRHIIRLMVELTAPSPGDVICDPASGTCGYLVAANEYLRSHHPEILRDAKLKEHFHHEMFHGFDFDNTMLRIGSMNMLLHGVENPDVRYKDSPAEEHSGDEESYTLVLANPPFAGSLDYENTAKDLQAIVKTKKTELLFLALFLRLLKPGGRAAVIVPDGVLFGSSKAHKELRRLLVEEQKLDGYLCRVVYLSPTRVFLLRFYYLLKLTLVELILFGSTMWMLTGGVWTIKERLCLLMRS